jgi:hypothetical protein
MEQRSSGTNAAGSIAVVGGLLAVIGSFLTWANASAGRFAFSAKGIDGWEGKATIVGGIVLLVAGINAFTKGSSDPVKRLGLLGGMVVAGVGIYTAVTAKDRVIDAAANAIAARLGVTVEQARIAVNQAVDSGALKIALDIGLFIVIAGGVLGIVAGLLAMRSKPAAPAMPAAAGGVGLTGWAAPPAPATPSPTEPAPTPWPTPAPTPEPSPPPAPPTAPPEPPPSDPGGGPAPT